MCDIAGILTLMIRRIHGTVADTTPTGVIVDVNGVGYLVYTTASHTYLLESTVTFYTYLAVRETALDLYGFNNRDDLDVFGHLLTIPKIGPKSALEILTKADALTLKNAVLSNDPTYLTKVSGIGKKTAEKIVSGLQDTFDRLASSYQMSGTDTTPSFTTDAIDALVSLGYPPVDARRIVQGLPKTVATTNDAVREALKQLNAAQ